MPDPKQSPPPLSKFQFAKNGKLVAGNFMFTALQDDRFGEHARWMAIIISLWSLIEEQLETLYGQLLNLDYKRSKMAYYAVQNYHAKRNTITAAIKEFHGDTEIESVWKGLQEDLKKAYKQRNTIAHGLWERHPTGALRLRATSVDGVFIAIEKPYQAAAFEGQALDISKLAAKLNDLCVLLVAKKGAHT